MPLAAGLGGGSSNAAATLLLLSDLFDHPLTAPDLYEMGCGLGSDVPFFLEPGPALAAGRGESIRRLASFPALRGTWMFLVHPGFGVSTPWAYQALGAFPDALNGRPGRAEALVALLQGGDARRAGAAFYNALEAPVLTKYPLLAMFQDHLRGLNPLGVLMSGSGSTTFSLWPDQAAARQAESSFRGRFGESCWTAVVPVQT
jgi:4-diphosphocytidyl-2-C-methyl-D-erythritol kinase